jgi:uncharacterized protein YcbK (DUF882 family)
MGKSREDSPKLVPAKRRTARDKAINGVLSLLRMRQSPKHSTHRVKGREVCKTHNSPNKRSNRTIRRNTKPEVNASKLRSSFRERVLKFDSKIKSGGAVPEDVKKGMRALPTRTKIQVVPGFREPSTARDRTIDEIPKGLLNLVINLQRPVVFKKALELMEVARRNHKGSSPTMNST